MTTPSWDLSIVYNDLADPRIQDDIALVEQCIDLLNKQSQDCENVEVMQNAILTNEAASRLAGTVYNFANCYSSVNATNAEAKALSGRMMRIFSELSQAFSAFELTLTHADDEFIARVLDHENPDISGQAFSIMESRKLADTRLSMEEEKLLAAMSVDGKSAWGNLYDNLTGSLKVTLDHADGTTEELGFSQAASILYGSEFDRQEAAWRGVQKAMETHQESFAAILNALAGWRLTENKKRSTKREVHFLDPSLYGSRIQSETLAAMMKVAKDSRDIGQKAGKLMAQVHGLDEMKPWNHLAAMPALSGDAKVYDFNEAIDVICEAFETVNPEMSEFVRLMVQNGWIDAAPNANKRLGAYCTKLPATRTPLVFMTWSGSRSDLMTLAHELGHAFHNWIIRDLPLCQTYYPMTLAETASIFAENIVRDHLISKAESVDDKLEMLWEELSSALALMINIPVRYEFEKAFYERRQEGELTAQDFCNLMSETWKDWYGDVMSEADPYFWASKLHFSIADVSFYNYPYLFGFLFSKGIYAQREAKGENFYIDYVNLLRDTGNMMAEEVVEKHLSMDLTKPDFWQQSVELVRDKVDEFERLLAQRSQ
ncbi:oligoendopeptidase F [Vibrio parahaemolyticus]|uniref:M3 family oligoendopeptidase n=2 Tax=Vibrio parahaemolyticus TaxID=670 RepID=UPI00061B221A|nr:M3 family oligoendopeptidase [Vibrio parahaemolyticus]EGQ8146102.1 M3 family oligoendopeptidase [Vibrio parahaemolyticus]EGQ8339684.1 M3 family oligoendopeptidase [Vibrio parahaemolyticus]EGQ8369694.1 M3 family oligoendopeptidase [Vibrio parahaemolyticus]EGQ8721835.1 M3 family oligoendopeptidase [Vibrio parahaemolyticus]EGQ8760851.1 M3 family oligoendopeptidase [Vibrio parahaemolyticus]